MHRLAATVDRLFANGQRRVVMAVDARSGGSTATALPISWRDLWAMPDRGRRVVLLLIVIWALNAFDLGSTLTEANNHLFEELNPLAARLLDYPAYALVLYKLALVGLASCILIWARQHRVSELGCWLMFAIYAGVTARWTTYYGHVIATLDDPAVSVCACCGLH